MYYMLIKINKRNVCFYILFRHVYYVKYKYDILCHNIKNYYKLIPENTYSYKVILVKLLKFMDSKYFNILIII